MATPTIQQGRLITKRSAIPGTVPTVPAVDDIETFTPTDIFKGELFYNIPDNILYIRDDTGIIIISSGGAPIPYVYYTENTTPGSEEAKIDVLSGSDDSYILTEPTHIDLYSTDGTNTGTLQLTPTTLLYNGSPIGGSGYTYITETTTPGSESIVIDVPSGGNDGSISITGNNNISMSWTDGTNTYGSVLSAAGSVLSANDGTNTQGVTVTTTQVQLAVTDGTTNTSSQTNTSNSIVLDILDSSSVVISEVAINTSDINIASTDVTITSGFGTGIFQALNVTDTSSITIIPNSTTLLSTDGTNQSQLYINPTGININSFDGLNNNILSISPINIKHSSIEYINYSKTTTNATPFTYVLYNVIGLSRVFNIKIRAIGISGITAYGAEMFGVFVFDSGSSTVTQVSTTDLIEKSTFTTATIGFSTSSQFINLVITGELATTIDWKFEIEIFE